MKQDQTEFSIFVLSFISLGWARSEGTLRFASLTLSLRFELSYGLSAAHGIFHGKKIPWEGELNLRFDPWAGLIASSGSSYYLVCAGTHQRQLGSNRQVSEGCGGAGRSARDPLTSQPPPREGYEGWGGGVARSNHLTLPIPSFPLGSRCVWRVQLLTFPVGLVEPATHRLIQGKVREWLRVRQGLHGEQAQRLTKASTGRW